MINKCSVLSVLFFCLLGITSCEENEKSMMMNRPHNIRGVVSYKRTFGEELTAHLHTARKLGIQPIESQEMVVRLGSRLQKVSSCSVYDVDSLKGTLPYLVPKAKELLADVGKNFRDSLAAKGLNDNRITVASMLQPTEGTTFLHSGSSKKEILPPHCYGTTFAISGRRFHQVEGPDSCWVQGVRSDTLQLVLSEVLRDLKKANRCHILYELSEDCFQITAR